MINPSYLVRSIGKFISELPAFSDYTVNVGLLNKEKVKNNNIVHVHINNIEAFSAVKPQVGSGSWAYPVIIDIWIPQNKLVIDYDDGPRGEISKALGDALIGAQIQCFNFMTVTAEQATGTYVTPTAVKLDFESDPAVRFEITVELS
jgi:hypothetical protein